MAFEATSLQSLFDILFKLSRIITHKCGSLVVQRIVRIRFYEQEDETEDDGVDTEYGLPIITQNIKAHITH